jgi:hypothetical protein
MPFDSRDIHVRGQQEWKGAGCSLSCWHLLMTSSIVGTPEVKRDDCRWVKCPTELDVRMLLSVAAMAGTRSLNETTSGGPAECAADSCWPPSRSAASAACRFVMMSASGMLCGGG